MNSASTCCVVDLLQNSMNRLQPPTPEEAVIKATRVATLVFGVLGISIGLCASALGEGLVDLNQTLNGCCSGPVLAVFMLGMTTGVGEKAALCAFSVAAVVSLYLGVGSLYCGRSNVDCTGMMSPGTMSVFWTCPIVTIAGVVVGLLVGCRNRAPIEQLSGLTWQRRDEEMHVELSDNDKVLLEDVDAFDLGKKALEAPNDET